MDWLTGAHVHIQSSTVFYCTSSRLHRVQQAALTSNADLGRVEQGTARPGEAHRGTPPVYRTRPYPQPHNPIPSSNHSSHHHHRRRRRQRQSSAQAHNSGSHAIATAFPPFQSTSFDFNGSALALLPSRHPFVQQSTRERAPTQPSTADGELHPLPTYRTASCLRNHVHHHPLSRLRYRIQHLAAKTLAGQLASLRNTPRAAADQVYRSPFGLLRVATLADGCRRRLPARARLRDSSASPVLL